MPQLVAVSPPTKDFRTLLRSLAEVRGFSRQQLAVAAGVHYRTIERAMSEEPPRLRNSNAISIMRALESAAPLTEQERSAFLRALNLEGLSEAARNVMAAPVGRQGAAFHTLLHAFPPTEARLLWRFNELMESLSPSVVSMWIDALAASGRVDLSDPPVRNPAAREAGPMRVVSPPVQRDGYIEQVVTEYGAAKPAKPVRRAKGA